MSNDENISDAPPVQNSTPDAAAENTPPGPPSINILTDPVNEFNCSKCDCLMDVSGLTAFTEIECPKCDSKEHVPARLGSFLLLKLLGTGGMGGVYYAKDETLGRFVAIKVMLQKLGNDPEFIETFRREAQAVAKLNHPNISQIYSFGQEKGQPYIVMEVITGEHVDEMMENGGIPPALAVRICCEVAQGLSAADDAGIVHGDIKPENILLDKSGRAKIVDFGLATVAHAAAEEGIWGTPYYIAPEKIRRQKIDARADIYSLGATLYHIIAGKPPFEGETPIDVVKARLTNPPPDLKEACPEVKDIVANIVTRMLATERTARYPTYKSLISDMRKALHELGDEPAKTARLGGKHIRFKNKRKPIEKSETPISKDSSSASSGQGGQKKIVIRKDKGRSAFKIKTKTNTDTNTEIDTDTDSSEEESKAIKQEKKKKRNKAIKTVLILISIILALGGIGAGIFFVMENNKVKRQKLIEYHAVKTAREKAEELCADISDNAEAIANLLPKTANYETTATEAVLLMTGEDLILQPVEEIEPEEVMPDESEDDVEETSEEDSENTSEEATTPEESEEAESEATEKNTEEEAPATDVSEKSDETDEAAEGEEADEGETDEGEADENQETDEIEEPKEPELLLIDENDQSLSITDIVDRDQPEVTVAARNLILNLQKLQAINLILQEINNDSALANKTIIKTTRSDVAKPLLKKITTMSKNCEIYKTKGRAIYLHIKSSEAAIVEMVKVHKENAEKMRKAELEAQKLREAEERKSQEQQRIEQLSKVETEQAKLDHDEMGELFSENNFDIIVKQLEKKLRNYQTEDGKNALQIYIDRYKYTAEMRNSIIACINKEPFSWGWGQGATARDIVKASELGISIKDSAKEYPWRVVNPAQMLKFVDHYTARKMSITHKRNLAIGAAVFCDEFGEKARPKSKAYLNKSITFGFRRDEAERLFEYDL